LVRKMLEKDPKKRITPEKALLHPYFDKDID
jgi:serine/threonine protein kinase